MAGKIKVVGYVRVSTSMQVDGKEFSSIEAQQAIIKEYVSKHPEMELVEIFTEPGRSGKNMKRPGIQALLRRVMQGDIKYVLSYKLDRISRETFDYYKFEKLMAEHNARVYYTNGFNSDGSPAGEFMKNLMVGLAVMERNQTSERIKDKIKESLKAGYKCGGYAPIGYVCGSKAKTMEIDEKTAPMVREIFSLYGGGLSIAGIVRHMSDKYVKMPARISRNGKIHERGFFSENKIGRILRNPIYAGYVFTKKPKLKLFDGLHQALVDRDMWHKIQKKLEDKAPVKAVIVRQRNPYLLKKILFCSCGANMTVGRSGKVHKDGSPYCYYVCSKKVHYKDQCSCKTRISLKVIESVLFSVIGHYAADGIKPVDISQNESEYKSSLLSEKKILTRQKSDNERRLKIAAKRFAAIDVNAALQYTLEQELKAISGEIERLATRLSEIDNELLLYEKNVTLGDIQNEAILQNLDALQNELTSDEKRDIIRLCIKKIVLKAKDIDPYKKDFLMAIFPTASGQTAFHSSIIEVLFCLDNSNGMGEWIITSPFELKCDNFGKVSRTNKSSKIKRHWLHQVVRWQKEYDAGSSLEDIAKPEGVGKSMICRKLKLLKNLSTDVIEAVLKLKYEKDTSTLTFRQLDSLADLPKDRQMKKLLALVKHLR